MTLNERQTPEKESENNYFNDTPRVNALIIELRKPCDGDRMDMISLARTLERSLAELKAELAAVTAERDALKAAYEKNEDEWIASESELLAENLALKAELSALPRLGGG